MRGSLFSCIITTWEYHVYVSFSTYVVPPAKCITSLHVPQSYHSTPQLYALSYQAYCTMYNMYRHHTLIMYNVYSVHHIYTGWNT